MSQYPPPPPPPFGAQPAPRKKGMNPWLVVLIIGILILVPCGAVVAGAFMFGNLFSKSMSPAIKCAATMDAARDALRIYAGKNGGRFPNSASWQSDIKPYFSNAAEEMKDMPFDFLSKADEPWECNAGDRKTAIYFNSELSGKILADIKNSSDTIIIFEDDGAAQLNNAKVYRARPKAEAPKNRFGGSDWFRIPVEGEAKGFGEGFESSSKGKKIEMGEGEDTAPDAPKSE